MERMFKDLSNCYDNKNSNLYREGYNYLINKLSQAKGIAQPEYKFLCWLNYNNCGQFPIGINKLLIPEIIEMSESDFSTTFSINSHRKDLYNKLLYFLKIKNGVFNCQYLDLLIGGSFTDKNKSFPHDIDCAFLLEKEIIDNYPAACNNDFRDYQGEELDAEFLDKESSFKFYRYYVWITMLGNEADIKDTDEEFSVKNNNFKHRDVFRVRFSYETIKGC